MTTLIEIRRIASEMTLLDLPTDWHATSALLYVPPFMCFTKKDNKLYCVLNFQIPNVPQLAVPNSNFAKIYYDHDRKEIHRWIISLDMINRHTKM